MRIHIFSGGRLGPWALSDLHKADLIIGADRGAYFLIEHGVMPHIALGDFDSVTDEQRLRIQQHAHHWIECDPVMKDMTDTEMAFAEALRQGADQIHIFGALGSRFDHSLANVHLLRKSLQHGISCTIEDACNRILLVEGQYEGTVDKDRFVYVSLLPLTTEVTGITLSGFQYPLQNATLQVGDSLGISNRIVGKQGKIQVGSGQLFVICSRDESGSPQGGGKEIDSI